ncbi:MULTISPECIES: serine hydrolase [Halolamina]|uniref:serine hydrolase n=1 Tax=Halolamina TaxID=1075397 RepID=UPI0014152ACE|nr:MULTISPECIES: serine hydrolase [Halolamina]NHX37499.1 serine hydrolase [Halolamina sp. R1-12]
MTEWLSDHRIPGAAVSVVDPDGTVYAEGFGARDLERNEPASEDTLFGIGSSTKSFTAIAIMQLVAEGELSVDDPVSDYLPHLDDAPGEPITIRELLTHTSGMPSDGMAGPLITRPLGLGHVEVPLSSEDDFRRHVQGSNDRRVTDRETFFYYNAGYTMLGEIVEEVTGDSYAEYVTEQVLDPLGMDRSTFDREEFESEEDRMTPYVKQEESSTESGFPFDQHIHAPGGLVSSAAEMGEYIRMYLNGGELDGASVLSPAAIDEMTTPEATFGEYIDGRDVEYGYGLMVEEFLDDRLVGHGGSIAVSNSWFGYLEEAELGVTISCTTSPEAHPMTVGPAILAIIQGADPVESVPFFRLTEALDEVTGEYESYRDIASATVERDGGTLKFTQEAGTGSQELYLAPETLEDDLLVCSTMTAAGMSHPVRFELDGDDVTCFFERSRFVKE